MRGVNLIEPPVYAPGSRHLPFVLVEVGEEDVFGDSLRQAGHCLVVLGNNLEINNCMKHETVKNFNFILMKSVKEIKKQIYIQYLQDQPNNTYSWELNLETNIRRNNLEKNKERSVYRNNYIEQPRNKYVSEQSRNKYLSEQPRNKYSFSFPAMIKKPWVGDGIFYTSKSLEKINVPFNF